VLPEQGGFPLAPGAGVASLSGRELEVARLVADGRSTRDGYSPRSTSAGREPTA
jgi:hypothetical protein